jgi:bifunctional DNA-binding transcriptional regulator/antitoxin component of YhaV-PrlF toxin-antitoxin module
MKTLGPYILQRTFSVVTVPEEVRKALGIAAGDVVFWVIDDEGKCILRKATYKLEWYEIPAFQAED